MKKFIGIACLILLANKSLTQNPYVVVLGIAQDGGYPQAGCRKACCSAVWHQQLPHQLVSSIALIDPLSGEQWIFDATPDFSEQLHILQNKSKLTPLSGIFLTHAHIGHYTGIMNLGREAMGAKNIKVFAMSRLKKFLENNGPWSQLITLQNIDIELIKEQENIILNERLKVIALKVPHRDEFSETVGFKISTAHKSLIFIPDIDKWQKWDKDLVEIVKSNDWVLIDGTFYADGEIDRPMSEVPHPFVVESMQLLQGLATKDKNKVHFIHLNHTNPLLNPRSKERISTENRGFKIAKQQQKFEL